MYSPPVALTVLNTFATNQNSRVAVVEMKNLSSADMWYTGYGPDLPLYIKQYKLPDGWLGPIDEGEVCGTGLGRCKLVPGESRKFSFFFWSEAPFRVGVRFSGYRVTPARVPATVYWSEGVFP